MVQIVVPFAPKIHILNIYWAQENDRKYLVKLDLWQPRYTVADFVVTHKTLLHATYLIMSAACSVDRSSTATLFILKSWSPETSFPSAGPPIKNR